MLLYAVILNGVKNLSGSTTIDPPTDCKILRSAQDDIALVLSETKETERPSEGADKKTKRRADETTSSVQSKWTARRCFDKLSMTFRVSEPSLKSLLSLRSPISLITLLRGSDIADLVAGGEVEVVARNMDVVHCAESVRNKKNGYIYEKSFTLSIGCRIDDTYSLGTRVAATTCVARV